RLCRAHDCGKETGWLTLWSPSPHDNLTTILLDNWRVLVTVKPTPPCHNFASRANRCAGQAHAAASHRRWRRDFRRSAVCLRKRLSLRLRKSRAPGLPALCAFDQRQDGLEPEELRCARRQPTGPARKYPPAEIGRASCREREESRV